MHDDEEVVWAELCDLSKAEFHGAAINFDLYSDLYQLTRGFAMSADYASQHIYLFSQPPWTPLLSFRILHQVEENFDFTI